MEPRSRRNLTPALVASALFHAGLAALALLSWQKAARKMDLAPVVPVTIVNDPPADLKAAQQADKPQTAQTPEPDEAAPDQQPAPPAPEPEPAAPPPQPEPTPPKPAPPRPAPPRPAPPKPAPPKPAPPKPAPPKPAPPKPTPKPAPTPPPKPAPQPKPTPAVKPPPAAKPTASSASKSANAAPRPAPAQAKPQQHLDLDALSASLSGMVAKKGAKPSSAARGGPRPETALEAVKGSGVSTVLSTTDRAALAAKLGRLWNPNCSVEGAANVVVKIHMIVSADGRLESAEIVGKSGSDDRVVGAAAIRARSAVGRGAPYSELSAGPKNFIFSFNAKAACAG